MFAHLLQQAIGGIEGEMRVMNQYLFQAWSSRGPKRYRDMLLNLAADMFADITAGSGGRLLATRLWRLTDDPGMKDMLSFLIARDTMHQNQWLAVLEELDEPLPIPHDFPQSLEQRQYSYAFFEQSDAQVPDDARWTSGRSIDGKGEFSKLRAEPYGEEPELAEAPEEMHDKVETRDGGGGLVSALPPNR